MTNIYEEINSLNKKYESNKKNGIKSIPNYKFYEGTNKIAISAPHGVKQQRRKLPKCADLKTGSIAEYIIKETNSYGIIRTNNLLDDPNYDSKGPGQEYKEYLSKEISNNKIKLLLDIHGCKSNNIDLGTNNYINVLNNKNLVLDLQKELSKHFVTTIDKKFKAKRKGTISNYISRTNNIPCIQIEIPKKIRTNEKDLNLFLDIIINFIKNR